MGLNCKSCNKEIANYDMTVCPNCGAFVCGDCYSKNGGVCEYCSSDMSYLQ